MESRLANRRSGESRLLRVCVSLHGAFSLHLAMKLNVPPFPEYKSRGAVKADDLRRRREEQQVEIRRQKREENISKRRNVFSTTSADSDDESTAAGWGDSAVSVKSRLSLVSFITCLHSSPKT